MRRCYDNSKHVALYAKYRPKTPQYVPEKIVTYMKKRNSSFDLMLDVGCGSGQSTPVFSPYFTKLIGVDFSSKQIEVANQLNQTPNITYKVGTAENLPIADESVDLVVSASAVGLHLFEIPVFFKECHRVLNPSGCLLLCSYFKSRPHLKEQLKSHSEQNLIEIGDQLLFDFQTEYTSHPAVNHFKDHYKAIFDMIKSNHKVRDAELRLDVDMKLSDYVGFLSSAAGYQAHREEIRKNQIEKFGNDNRIDEDDLLNKLVVDAKKMWGLEKAANEDISVTVVWDYFLIMSERPNAKVIFTCFK